MDPWGNISPTDKDDKDLFFKDSYVAKPNENDNNKIALKSNVVTLCLQPANNEKLANSSDVYLQRLESKLKRLNASQADKKLNASNILKSLQSRKDIQFEDVLTYSSTQNNYDNDLEPNDVNTNVLRQEFLRKFYPEAHAVNNIELLNLLEYDLLSTVTVSEKSNTLNEK